MLKADDDDDDSTFPSLFCEVAVVEPPPRSCSSPRSSSTSSLLPPPGTNAGAFAFMVLYLCVSLLRSDWNEVTGLPLLEKVKTSSIIFSSITTATAMVERVKKSER